MEQASRVRKSIESFKNLMCLLGLSEKTPKKFFKRIKPLQLVSLNLCRNVKKRLSGKDYIDMT